MFGLVVRFDLHPGVEASFDHLVAETLLGVESSEPGTFLYACHTVADNKNARVFYELYADEAAFAAHETQTYTKRFLAERGQYLSTPPRVEFFSSFAGKNLPTSSVPPS